MGLNSHSKWWNDSKILVIQYSRVSVLWIVEFWKRSITETLYTFMADASNTELLFRIIHSLNRLSIYGALSNWCEQFGQTEEEKGQDKPRGKKESVTKSVLTSVKSQEVNLLVCSPRPASGRSLWDKIKDFESLPETIRFVRVGEDTIFVHWVSASMSYKNRPDEDDGFGQIIPFCRDYTNPRSRVFAAIPGEIIIGPVIEVQIVKIIDTYGLDIASPSPNESRRTSYVIISRGKSRFVGITLWHSESRRKRTLLGKASRWSHNSSKHALSQQLET